MVARSELRVPAPKTFFRGPIYEDIIRPLQEERWDDVPREALIEGGTGVGKSFMLSHAMRRDMRMNPGVHWLIIRRFRADLPGSWMQTWEDEVLDPTDSWDAAMLDGPQRTTRTTYEYPNGSVAWIRGMNQWPRVKSMAFDRIWGVEATELREEHAEGLTTRVRARKGISVPCRWIWWDVNPGPPGHWLNRRALAGVCKRLTVRMIHNPGYWDAQRKCPTPEGLEYIQRMLGGGIRGHNLRRLWHCEWAAATGLILDTYADSTHCFDGDIVTHDEGLHELHVGEGHPTLPSKVKIGWYLASMDWGRRDAATLQVWAIDTEGRQYLIEEYYHSKRTVYWWSNIAADVARRYKAGQRGVTLKAIVCDNAWPDNITTFNRELEAQVGPVAACAIECKKATKGDDWSNLDVLISAFEGRNQRPEIYFSRRSLQHQPDQELKTQRISQEVPGWVYAEYDEERMRSRPKDEPDARCANHGLDAATYARVYIMGGRRDFTPNYRDWNEWNPRRAELITKQVGWRHTLGDTNGR